MRVLSRSACAEFPGREPAPRAARASRARYPQPTTRREIAKNMSCSCNSPSGGCNDRQSDGMSRRSFLRTSAVLASGLAALAASLVAACATGRFYVRRAVPAEVLQGTDAGGHGEGAEAHRRRSREAIRRSGRMCAITSRWTASSLSIASTSRAASAAANACTPAWRRTTNRAIPRSNTSAC